jgi:hypothetical protein
MRLIKTALIIGAALALATGAFALTGGPDGGDYSFEDCDEPTGPTSNVEAPGGNEVFVGLGDDQTSGPLPIGFTFTFYGVDYTNFYISSNGFIDFDGGGNGCCAGQPIPGSGQGPMIAGYWEDLDPPEGGTIEYETFGTSPDSQLNVTFRDIQHFNGGPPSTFQWKLFETSNIVEVHYGTMFSDGGNHSAGQEDGATGLQYMFGDFNPTDCAVRYSMPQPEPSPSPSPMPSPGGEPGASAPGLTGSGLLALVAILMVTSVLMLRRRIL